MENPLRKQIRSIMKDHKKRQMWYRIVTTLAVVVVFVTTYMLILPAITMENKAECGITEHKHDANCYSSHYEKEKELACTTDSLGVHKHTEACYDAEHKLICGYADFVIHEHDASCYDKDGNLVCTIPEHKLHQHTPECYQMQKQLVCTQEESVGHTHTPECYTKQQGALICGKEEHTHGEGCYDAEGNLICTLEEHTHSDECYEWTEVLTCTIPESAGHTHSEACYQDVQVLICEEPAELHTHTAECYKDGVLACGKLELKEHKHSETCFTEKQVLVETLICDRVEHVHTDECYKKSTEETTTSEAVTASQNEETSSEDESSETASIEETSTEETSTEEVSSETDTDAEEPSTEASSEETSIEETSLEASSEDESEAESETESAEEAESESEVESESESETEESSSIEAESEEESSEEESSEAESEEESSEEESSEEETFDDIDNLMLDEEEQFVVMLTSSNAVKMDKTNTTKLSLSGGTESSQTTYDPNKHLYYTRVNLDFIFNTSTMSKDSSEYYFEYPEGIIIPDDLLDDSKELHDSKHHKAGTYRFEKGENGKYRVIIDFDPEYVKTAGSEIEGFVNFNGSIDENKGKNDGSIEIKGSDGVELIIPKEDIKYPDNETNAYGISVTKAGSYKVEDGKLVYTVWITSPKGTPGNINFEDTITASGIKLGTDAPILNVEKVTVVRHCNNGVNDRNNNYYDQDQTPTETVNISDFQYNDGKIKMTLPKLEGFKNPNETDNTVEYTKYKVTYTYNVTDPTVKNPSADNTVKVNSSDKTTEVKDQAQSHIGITNEHTMSKSGLFDKEHNQIKWTITVNDNHMDIAGSTLTDKMFASLKNGTNIKVDPSEGCTIDSVNSISRFNEVADGKNNNKYTITYYTEATGNWDKETVVNDAKFKPGDGSGEIDKTGSVDVSDGSIAKSVGTATMLEDGKTIEIPWKVTITIPKSGMKSGTIIKDDPTGGASHYMTYAQIVNWAKNIYWADGSGTRLSNGNLDLTYLANIKFKASDGSTYDYSDILGDESTFKNLTFTTWEITLKNDLTLPENAKQLIFEYKTTADTSSAGIGTTSYKNNIQSEDKSANAQYDYKKGGVVKTDEGNQEGTTVKNNEDGTLTWKIKTTLGSETSTLTVKDTLPKGVKLVAIKGEDWINNLNNIQIAEDGTIYGIENNYYEVIGTYTNDIVTLKLGIKDNNSKLSKGATYTFVLTCKIDTNELQDYESGKKYTFTNHATASDDKGSIGSAEQTQEWTEEKKTQKIKVVDKSGSWDNNSRRVKYQIKLNPDGKDIVASSDVLTLTDEFTYYKFVNAHPVGNWSKTQNYDVNAWLLPDTVKLYKATKQEDGSLTKGDLITNWSWTVATRDVPNVHYEYDTYSLSTITSDNIPDGIPLILEYEYQIQTDIPENWESSSSLRISNKAKLEGTAYEDDDTRNNADWKVQESSAGVTTDRQYTIYKVSKGDYGKVLQGAEFKLQKYDENGDYTDTGKVYTTDEEGMITIKWQKEASDYQYEANTLYRLIEVKAPEGYTLPSPMQVEKNAVYFYFSSAKEGVENHLPETLPNGAWDLSKASQTSYIENEEENVKVDIQKKWMYTTEGGQDKYVAAWESQIEVALYRKESTKDPADETKETATLFMQPNSWDGLTNKGEYPLGTVINLTLQATGDQWNQGYLPKDIKWNELVATPVEEILGTSENGWLHTKKYRFVMTESENTLRGYENENIISSLDFQIPVAPEDSLVGKYTLNATNNWRVSVTGLQRTGTNSDNETVYYTYYIKELTKKEGVTVTYNNNNGITSGTITVTNKKPEPKEYVLPETGGTGTYWYTMGGVLLTAGAAFLIYKKHMQKGGRRIW